jgi:hypothetical protein
MQADNSVDGIGTVCKISFGMTRRNNQLSSYRAARLLAEASVSMSSSPPHLRAVGTVAHLIQISRNPQQTQRLRNIEKP